MIRGHIDFVSRSRVEGWIACDRLALTGARVLAFVDETCIGGGSVDVYRPDLVDAGLGAGTLGFGFAIAPEPWHDTRALDIRMEGGAMILKQAKACLVAREEVGEDRRRQGRDPASLAWMLARGWIGQAHYDALRTLSQFGVHEQALRFVAPPSDPVGRCDEAALAAADVVELHVMQTAELEIREDVAPGDLPEIRRELRAAFPHVPPVIGLWAREPRHVDVVEGSHRPGAPAAAGGGVEYAFGDRRLLMLDLDAEHSFARTAGGPAAFAAFVPRRSRG